MQFLYLVDVVHMPQKTYPGPGIGFQIAGECAAIIRISGNRQNTLGWSFLEALDDHCGIVLWNQTAGNQVILARFQAVLAHDLGMGRALDVRSVGDAC